MFVIDGYTEDGAGCEYAQFQVHGSANENYAQADPPELYGPRILIAGTPAHTSPAGTIVDAGAIATRDVV
jgi:hypothetical protein